MWVVRKMYWRSGQQYVQAQKIFESREEAIFKQRSRAHLLFCFGENKMVKNLG